MLESFDFMLGDLICERFAADVIVTRDKDVLKNWLLNYVFNDTNKVVPFRVGCGNV